MRFYYNNIRMLLCMTMAFLTAGFLKAQVSIPYTMDFEDTSAFHSWTMTNCQANTGITTLSAQTGSYGFSFHWDLSPQYLISPQLPGLQTPLELQFAYRRHSAQYVESFKVGYSTTTNAVSSFTWGQEIVVLNTDWETYNMIIPAGSQYVAIQYTAIDAYYLYVDNIRIDNPPSCMAPTELTVSNFTGTSVDLSWTANSNENEWVVLLNDTGETVYSSPHSLFNLTPLTSYTASVRAVCGSGDTSAFSQPISFTMPCDCVPNTALPYSENFESFTSGGSINPCWFRYSGHDYLGTQYTAPVVLTTQGHSGNNCLEFLNTIDYINYLTLPCFEEDLSNLQISFYQKSFSSYYGHGYPFVVGVLQSPDNYYQMDTLYAGTITPDWSYVEVPLSNYTGSGQFIAIVSTHSSADLLVDDIVVDYLSNCLTPSDLRADSVTENSITLSWTENGQASLWSLLCIRDNDTVQTLHPTTNQGFTVFNLAPDTQYEFVLRSVCGNDSSHSTHAVFRTHCGAHITIPFTENFEDYGSTQFPFCWTKISQNNYPYTYSSAAFNGNYGLYFYQTTFENCNKSFAVVPAIDPSIPLNQLTVRFQMRRTSNSVKATLGVMSQPNDTSSFSVISPIALTNNWDEYEFPLTNFTGNGSHIAVKTEVDTANGTYGNIYMDDFEIFYTPSCQRVISISTVTSSITENSATVVWVPSTGQSTWEVQVVLQGQQPSDSNWVMVASDTLHTFTGLQANTAYTAHIRTNCGSLVSGVRSVDFRTACGQLALPYFEDFESYPSGSSEFPPCWSSLAGSPHTYSGGSSFGESGNSLKFSGHYDILATPFVPHNADDLQLSFQLKREGNSSGSILVGFTTSLSNVAVIDTIAVISPTDNLYHYYEFNLNQYNLSGQGYFVFKQSGYNNYWYWMDNVRIRPVPNCLAPANLTVSDVTSSSVTLAWDAAAMANNYRVVFGTGNFNPDTVSVNVEHTSDTFVTIYGLATGVNYTFYLQSDCGSDSSSFGMPVSIVPGLYLISGQTSLSLCDGVLYDDGGPYSNYGSNRNDIITLYPSTPGAAIQLSGTLNSENSYDFLTIYDGVGTNGIQLYRGSGINQTVPPVSSATALTVQFTSDGGTQYSGFVLNIECVSCAAPLPNLVSVSSDEAVVSWDNPGGLQTQWELAYGPAGFNVNTAPHISVATNSYTLSGLNLNTAYDVRLRTLCYGGDTSIWSPALSFTTLGLPATTIPYQCDFEDSTENANWTLVNGSTVNRWVIGTAVNHTPNGHTALYISQDNGASNTYNNTSASCVWAYRDFDLSNYGEYLLSFDWRGYGESSFDYINVYIGNPVVPTPGAALTPPAGSTLILSNLNRDSLWKHTAVVIDGRQHTGVKRIYFMWRNDYSGGINPAGAIDNVVLTGFQCLRPSQFAASNPTFNSIDLSWSPASSSDGSWDIVYGTGDFNPDTVSLNLLSLSDTIATLQGLSDATQYYAYVRTNCGGGETSLWSDPLPFRTSCQERSIPYYENFDTFSSGETPICWNDLSQGSSYARVSTTDSLYAPTSLYILQYNSEYLTMVSLPELDNAIPLNTLQMSFHTKFAFADAKLVVGTMTDNTNSATFVPYDTVTVSTNGTWESKRIRFNRYTGNAHILAFKFECPQYNNAYIDNILVEEIPLCTSVLNVDTVNVTSTSATIAWTPGNIETEWNLQFKSDTGSWSNAIAVTGTPNHTLTGLTPSTTYQVRVQAVCDIDNISDWSGTLMFTTDTVVPPFVQTYPATDITHNSARLHGTVTPGSEAIILDQGFEWKETVGGTYVAVTIYNFTYLTMGHLLTDLTPNTGYTFRAFAITASGTTYGAEQNFTTLQVGIDNYTLDNAVTVFPNPTTGIIQIKNGEWRMENVEVYDAYGKLLNVMSVNDHTATLDLNGYAKGTYFVRVMTERGVVTKRVVKN